VNNDHGMSKYTKYLLAAYWIWGPVNEAFVQECRYGNVRACILDSVKKCIIQKINPKIAKIFPLPVIQI
jgi:hypothetical protein